MRERKILHTREFMRVLLTTDTFDDWLLAEAQIVCANTWTIDGHVNHAYFKEASDGESPPDAAYVPWAQIRPTALSLIRGKRTPLSFRFTLLPPGAGERMAPDDPAGAAAVDRLCRIRFTEGYAYAASTVSMRSFSLDKEPERIWDEALSRFLDDEGIAFEEL